MFNLDSQSDIKNVSFHFEILCVRLIVAKKTALREVTKHSRFKINISISYHISVKFNIKLFP